MGHRFYDARCLFFSTILVFTLLFPAFSQETAKSEKKTKDKTCSSSTAADFQEIKKEVGYSDPQRYGKGEVVNLIKWLLVGAGIWCLVMIFLYALFCKSSIDKNWVKEQSEENENL